MDNAGVDTATTVRAERRRQGGAWRSWRGAAVGVAGLATVTAALLPVRGHVSLGGVTLLFLVPVVAVAIAGGVWPALTGAIAADMLVNFFFVPPYHTLVVDSPANAIVLLVYVFVAATVAIAVDVAARQRASAGTGLGLGLAIARGFTEAMDGTLAPSDTPGGGLTMTINIPVES